MFDGLAAEEIEFVGRTSSLDGSSDGVGDGAVGSAISKKDI